MGAASMKAQAVKTNGPVKAGRFHLLKKFWSAGIVKRLQTIVAAIAYRKVCHVSGRKLVSAIMTRT
jgi:hypothetical protein